MFVIFECARCGLSQYDYHGDHGFQPGKAEITLTKEEVAVFIAQGDDSTFKGNDLLYPIYEVLKASA